MREDIDFDIVIAYNLLCDRDVSGRRGGGKGFGMPVLVGCEIVQMSIETHIPIIDFGEATVKDCST